MTISLADVETIAELAKLTLSDEEKTMLQTQLSNILEYATMLQQVDTSGVPASASPLPLNNVMRADIVGLSLPNEAALYNAPDAADGQFRVRAVLD